MDWRKRGTAEGFSSVNFVLPLLMMSCWFKHGVLTNDYVNMFINGINLLFSLSTLPPFGSISQRG
jgi:hypothetical protein